MILSSVIFPFLSKGIFACAINLFSSSSRNIIWDSYETFLSPFDRYHFHTYIVQVKVEEVDRLKYIEVKYNPQSDKIESDFEWNAEIQDFEEVEKVKEPEAINS